MPALKPYSGHARKLVIAFDVGTTFSGISYAVLDPGQVPELCAVNRSVVDYPFSDIDLTTGHAQVSGPRGQRL
jgi:hypothetical protein